MGRLFSLIVVMSILFPFFAVARQVDAERRDTLAGLSTAAVPAAHFRCRAWTEACGDDGE